MQGIAFYRLVHIICIVKANRNNIGNPQCIIGYAKHAIAMKPMMEDTPAWRAYNSIYNNFKNIQCQPYNKIPIHNRYAIIFSNLVTAILHQRHTILIERNPIHQT
jgi:hypothetical protein